MKLKRVYNKQRPNDEERDIETQLCAAVLAHFPTHVGLNIFPCFCLGGCFHLDNSIAIYWLDANNIVLRPLLACVLLPGMLIFCMLKFARHKYITWLLIAMAGINIIALLALPGGILRDYQRQATVEFNNHVYYLLSSYGTVGIGRPRPLIDVYECEKSGFLCRKIYRHNGSSLQELGEAGFLPDPATNTLALEINGEVVYTHHP